MRLGKKGRYEGKAGAREGLGTRWQPGYKAAAWYKGKVKIQAKYQLYN